jgi:type I restriction enzyme S subunit
MGKYQSYPEYKESGVEWLEQIPVHWNVKKLKYICRVKTGDKDTVMAVDEGKYPFFVRSQTVERINTVGADCEAVLTAGDGVGVGKVFHYYNGKFDYHQRVYMLHDFTEVFGRFVFYYLSNNFYKVALEGNAKSTVDYLRLPQFLNFEFSLPALADQKKIVNFLDHETAKIDTLIEKQQQLIALLKEKRQAVISRAVTKGLNANAPMRDSGVERLGEVPEHWVSCALKYYARIVDCKHITAEFFDEGIPLASIGEVKEWHVNLATAKLTNEKYYLDLIGGGRKPEAGDIIYSRNATVGEAALVVKDMPDFAMGQDVCLIRLDEGVLPEYILYVLKSGVISNQLDLAMVGSTFKRINVDDIRNFVIALPSYEEQIDIVAELTRILGKYDALVTNAESTVELLSERRTALISAAVTGKIDVRNWSTPEENKNKEVA